MIKKVCLIAYQLLLFSLVANSQSNFVNATIVQKNGQELVGQIDYQEWKKNPRKVLFKAKNAEIIAFLPQDISGFTITDNAEKYISATVKLSVETANDDKLIEYNSLIEAIRKLKFETETHFLLVLKTGDLSLYSLTDKNGQEHFFSQKNKAAIHELIYRKVIIGKENKRQIREIKDYVFQFQKDVFDCAVVFDQLETLSFKGSDFMNIVDVYNNYKKQNIYTKGKDKRQSGFYVFGGIDKPSTVYNVAPSTLIPVTLDVKLIEKNNPILGFGYDLGFTRNLNKWGAAFEVFYKPVQSTLTKQYPNNLLSSYKDTYYFNVDMHYLQVNAFLRHTFYTGKIKPYVKAGPGFAFILKSDNFVEILNGFNNTSDVKYVEMYKRALNFNLGVGVKKDNFFVEARFAFESNLSNRPNKTLQSQYFSIIGGYAFFKK